MSVNYPASSGDSTVLLHTVAYANKHRSKYRNSHILLHHDLVLICSWSFKWQETINITKCKHVLLTAKAGILPSQNAPSSGPTPRKAITSIPSSLTLVKLSVFSNLSGYRRCLLLTVLRVKAYFCQS